MDLDAVRTFVAAADAGRFRDAAADLSVTQQAVSKRVAALERELGVRLFARTPRGARLTVDGQAFLPHARDLLRAEERAAASVRPGRRPLRVDVLGARFAPADLLRGFLRAHPGTALDAVTLRDAAEAVAAVSSGTADATFRAVPMPGSRLPDGVAAVRVLDEPLHLIVGPGHPLAGARAVTPAQLAGHRIWIPGIMPGTEWAAYYADLSAVFGLAIGRRTRSSARRCWWTRWPRRLTWPRSSASARGSCGRPGTTCGAFRSATRRRSTRTRWCGATTTRTRRSPPCGTTSPPCRPPPPGRSGRPRGPVEPLRPKVPARADVLTAERPGPGGRPGAGPATGRST